MRPLEVLERDKNNVKSDFDGRWGSTGCAQIHFVIGAVEHSDFAVREFSGSEVPLHD
jgi:hypothetical protein